jgi:Fe-S-cluster containining protein
MMAEKIEWTELCHNCKGIPCCTDFQFPYVSDEQADIIRNTYNIDFKFTKVNAPNNDTPELVIINKPETNECIFWNKENGCSIYEKRPFDCRLFPFDIYLFDGVAHWVVFSCNPDSDWTWSENSLKSFENDPAFKDYVESIYDEQDLDKIRSESPRLENYTKLRKVNFG